MLKIELNSHMHGHFFLNSPRLTHFPPEVIMQDFLGYKVKSMTEKEHEGHQYLEIHMVIVC
jgi:hypothetical protein